MLLMENVIQHMSGSRMVILYRIRWRQEFSREMKSVEPWRRLRDSRTSVQKNVARLISFSTKRTNPRARSGDLKVVFAPLAAHRQAVSAPSEAWRFLAG